MVFSAAKVLNVRFLFSCWVSLQQFHSALHQLRCSEWQNQRKWNVSLKHLYGNRSIFAAITAPVHFVALRILQLVCEFYPSRDAVRESRGLGSCSEERQRVCPIQHGAEWIWSHWTGGGRWGGSAAFPPSTARLRICHLRKRQVFTDYKICENVIYFDKIKRDIIKSVFFSA